MYKGLQHSSSAVTLCRVVLPLSKVFSPALNNSQAVSYMHYSSLGIALGWAVYHENVSSYNRRHAVYGEVFINARCRAA